MRYNSRMRREDSGIPAKFQQPAMKQSMTLILDPDSQGITEAAKTLKEGGLVAFPTETVYGLGADARNGRAVAGIFSAKGRPRFNPLIVHLESAGKAREIAELDPVAEKLAEAFWPGPLTLVLPKARGSGISELVTAGGDMVAVRVPSHSVARSLIETARTPVAAPSANSSGMLSPTRAEHVMKDLDGRVDALLKGEIPSVGLESTIVKVAKGKAEILRPGGISQERIAESGVEAAPGKANPLKPSSPGQLDSHYAPRCRLRLNAEGREANELLLGFGPVANADMSLSKSGDLVEAAANLFACMHALETRAASSGAKGIAVSPVPNAGLGRAINDRLSRAAQGNSYSG